MEVSLNWIVSESMNSIGFTIIKRIHWNLSALLLVTFQVVLYLVQLLLYGWFYIKCVFCKLTRFFISLKDFINKIEYEFICGIVDLCSDPLYLDFSSLYYSKCLRLCLVNSSKNHRNIAIQWIVKSGKITFERIHTWSLEFFRANVTYERCLTSMDALVSF